MTTPAADQISTAHRRFAKAALAIYVAVATIAVGLLVAGLVTDRTHDEDQLKHQLLLETRVRSRLLAEHLGGLTAELERLARRAEVDFSDETLGPERALLDVAHGESALFDLGIAIVDGEGKVLWAEPREFLPRGNELGDSLWFQSLKRSHLIQVVPVEPEAQDAALFLVAPVVRAGEFTGALVGGLDLAHSRAGLRLVSQPDVLMILATQAGDVVYPSVPPPFAQRPAWRELFAEEPRFGLHELDLGQRSAVVASSPLPGGELVLLAFVPEDALFAAISQRFTSRLMLGVVLAVLPLALLVGLLLRLLRQLGPATRRAVAEERLRRTGEAVNVVAHEVRNSLNGLKMGLDLVLRTPKEPSPRVVSQLHAEIDRLGNFARQLMLFAKEPKPTLRKTDMGALLDESLKWLRETCVELGVELRVTRPEGPLTLEVDPDMIRIIISNLVLNAIDAVTTQDDGPLEIDVRIELGDSKFGVLVEDSGPGVAPSIRADLFEPFMSGKPSGVGIGLSTSRRIARAHGGDLCLMPSDRGARFELQLPFGAR